MQGLKVLEEDSAIIQNINKIFKIDNLSGMISYQDGRIDPISLLRTLNTYLKNKKINFDNIAKAKKIISKEFSPLSDVRSSKNYRIKIVSNLLDRFLNEYNNKRVTVYDY